MYSSYQDRQELEDDLYKEDGRDSEDSEDGSELEFRLYSQLHYSANAEEIEEQDGETEDGQPPAETAKELAHDGELKSVPEAGLPPQSTSVQKQQPRTGKSKPDKRKRSKCGTKGQTSPFSTFEEVIVIDSSPEVISLSEEDSTNDDIGVCTLKGQVSSRLQPPSQAHQAKDLVSSPETVNISSSESEGSESKSESESSESSSELSTSSDSDGLENWMLLGPGKQDGDQSISLNLEGGSDSNADPDEEDISWLVSDKDKDAQIFNKDKGARVAVQRFSNRYYTTKNVQCRNCNRTGHLSKNCPEPKRLTPCYLCGTPGHQVIACPNKHCNNCGLPGHLYDSCTERAYWHKQCRRCSMTGHFFDACPEIWRQYHLTTNTGPPVKQQEEDNGRNPAFCYNCSRKGHFGHSCTRQRMFNGTYASTPFINYYDTVVDIRRRQHRLKLKVKDLKKNGLFSSTLQTPLTPGPPRKRQKVSHDRTNQHTHRNNYKSSPSHIFFSEDNDSRAVKPHLNKYKKQGNLTAAQQWKPKRPVPASREQPPPPKLILDEADDFPRGGSREGSADKKTKRRRRKKLKHLSSEEHQDGRPDGPCWAKSAGNKETKSEIGEKRRRIRPCRRIPGKKLDAEMYPADENLFIIKQRKRKR